MELLNNQNAEEDHESQDEELYMNLVQRLPVATFDKYDPNVPPQNGAEYLRRVQLEARKEPKIKVAEDSTDRISKNFDNHHSIIEQEFIKSSFRFSDQIVTTLLQSFQNLRQHLEKLRIQNEDSESKPMKRTRKWWREHCLSKTDNQSKVNDYQCLNHYQMNLPRMGLLSQLPQKEIVRLLNYHYEWLQEDGWEEFCLERGLWIYSLMAALDQIQPDDTYCLLRQISRLCSQIRLKCEEKFCQTNADDNQEFLDKISSLNLIILLVGHHFKQKDLLDTWCG